MEAPIQRFISDESAILNEGINLLTKVRAWVKAQKPSNFTEKDWREVSNEVEKIGRWCWNPQNRPGTRGGKPQALRNINSHIATLQDLLSSKKL